MILFCAPNNFVEYILVRIGGHFSLILSYPQYSQLCSVSCNKNEGKLNDRKDGPMLQNILFVNEWLFKPYHLYIRVICIPLFALAYGNKESKLHQKTLLVPLFAAILVASN